MAEEAAKQSVQDNLSKLNLDQLMQEKSTLERENFGIIASGNPISEPESFADYAKEIGRLDVVEDLARLDAINKELRKRRDITSDSIHSIIPDMKNVIISVPENAEGALKKSTTITFGYNGTSYQGKIIEVLDENNNLSGYRMQLNGNSVDITPEDYKALQTKTSNDDKLKQKPPSEVTQTPSAAKQETLSENLSNPDAIQINNFSFDPVFGESKEDPFVKGFIMTRSNLDKDGVATSRAVEVSDPDGTQWTRIQKIAELDFIDDKTVHKLLDDALGSDFDSADERATDKVLGVGKKAGQNPQDKRSILEEALNDIIQGKPKPSMPVMPNMPLPDGVLPYAEPLPPQKNFSPPKSNVPYQEDPFAYPFETPEPPNTNKENKLPDIKSSPSSPEADELKKRIESNFKRSQVGAALPSEDDLNNFLNNAPKLPIIERERTAALLAHQEGHPQAPLTNTSEAIINGKNTGIG